MTGGAWSTTRFSVFFITKVDGTLDVWDLLVQQDSPVLSVKVDVFLLINLNLKKLIKELFYKNISQATSSNFLIFISLLIFVNANILLKKKTGVR